MSVRYRWTDTPTPCFQEPPRAADAPAPARNPAPFRADTKQNRGLMILGGAGMLTGAVIGGDAGSLISVGGAVVFLWGLYQYVK